MFVSFAQPWTYDFGTVTSTANNANSGTGLTTFFTGTPAGGGTYRVRVGTGSGSISLANPGTSLGSGSELQMNAATGLSTNKFSVYSWSNLTTVAYLKTKIRTTSSGNGNLAIFIGTAPTGSTNLDYTGEYAGSLSTLWLTYTAGSLSNVTRRSAGAATAISSSGLSKDSDQIVEIYCNNASTSTTYYAGGVTNSLNAQSWDLWVGGTKTSSSGGWGPANSPGIGANVNLGAINFYAQSSTGNAAFMYLDDLEYSNALPTPPAPSLTATGTINAMSTIEGTPSTEQSFTVSGSNLTANLVVSAPSGFEVSSNSTSGYSSSINLTPSSGSVASTTLYARIASTTLAGSYSGNITVSSTGATSSTIAIPNSTVSAATGLSQTISFGVLPGVTYGDSPLTLSATASSGLAVTYASSNTSVVTVSGSTLTIVGVGSASVTASQSGDATYNPATDVVRGIIVSPKTLTVTNAAASDKVFNNNSSAGIVTGKQKGLS